MRIAILMIFLIILGVSCKEKGSSERQTQAADTTLEIQKEKDTIHSLLKVNNPTPGQSITSPLEITGEARGYWFFEADAPVELLDGNLQTISESHITATGEWMTEDWVPFSGTMTFVDPETENGFLVLHKANASGLEEHAMSDTIKVGF